MAHQQDHRARDTGEGQGPALSVPAATIAAVATAPGRGGIGIVRVSGPRAAAIARAVLGRVPQPRHATRADFRDGSEGLLDQGIALYFPAPHSYTGEDVLELQGHGGPVVLHEILRRCVALGARVAEPGEFTRRAFLNERLDLAQAEGVADLIEAASIEAARGAARSLSGEFSTRIKALVESLVDLRLHVEACIDFPEEEIDPADRQEQRTKLEDLRAQLRELQAAARQGQVLREGLSVVLVGRPNVGKSSLLNRLAGEDLAIVTPIAGTTRDTVRATITIEGVPFHLVDTAGLRESGDEVERQGIERTWAAIAGAGAALFIRDDPGPVGTEEAALLARLPEGIPVLRVENKSDLRASTTPLGGFLPVSAKSGQGLDALRRWLLEAAGWQPHGEGLFTARARHVVALEEAGRSLDAAAAESQAFEFVAEDLRLAQLALARITGEFSADDLLGEIFGRFCIGK